MNKAIARYFRKTFTTVENQAISLMQSNDIMSYTIQLLVYRQPPGYTIGSEGLTGHIVIWDCQQVSRTVGGSMR